MNVLDLFCGASGGWCVGLARAGYRTVAACELDDWRRSVFAAAHPGCRMYADVRELTADRLRADLGFLPDIVVGSPPCQEISSANTKGKGITDDHLFWEWARLVFEIRPLWCGAENSPRSRTEGIDDVLAALDQARYASWPCVVGAVHAGANHGRLRLWLLAADADRHELWQQPWRSGRTNGRRAALARQHDRHADCGAQGALGGFRVGPDAEPSRVAEYAPEIARLGFGGVCGLGGDQSAQTDLSDDADPDGRLASGARRHADGCLVMGARADGGDLADADCEPRRRVAGPEWQPRIEVGYDALPPELRAIGEAWPNWNGGVAGLAAACAAAGFGAVDDGSNAFLAPSLRNRAIAALGDAVLPQIPEAIGRAMLSLGGSVQ